MFELVTSILNFVVPIDANNCRKCMNYIQDYYIRRNVNWHAEITLLYQLHQNKILKVTSSETSDATKTRNNKSCTGLHLSQSKAYKPVFF